MNYDELEEQYYILTQANQALEKANNSLELENTNLEAKTMVLEGTVRKLEIQNHELVRDYQQENFKVINLKVQLESAQKELAADLDVDKRKAIRSAVLSDSEILQNHRNMKDLRSIGVHMPKYNTYEPMVQQALHPNQSRILLEPTDVFGFYKQMDGSFYEPTFHLYGKCGDKVIRYATKSMFELERREDFAVVLNQMTSGLMEAFIDEYSKTAQFR